MSLSPEVRYQLTPPWPRLSQTLPQSDWSADPSLGWWQRPAWPCLVTLALHLPLAMSSSHTTCPCEPQTHQVDSTWGLLSLSLPSSGRLSPDTCTWLVFLLATRASVIGHLSEKLSLPSREQPSIIITTQSLHFFIALVTIRNDLT